MSCRNYLTQGTLFFLFFYNHINVFDCCNVFLRCIRSCYNVLHNLCMAKFDYFTSCVQININELLLAMSCLKYLTQGHINSSLCYTNSSKPNILQLILPTRFGLFDNLFLRIIIDK